MCLASLLNRNGDFQILFHFFFIFFLFNIFDTIQTIIVFSFGIQKFSNSLCRALHLWVICHWMHHCLFGENKMNVETNRIFMVHMQASALMNVSLHLAHKFSSEYLLFSFGMCVLLCLFFFLHAFVKANVLRYLSHLARNEREHNLTGKRIV